ncbi:hypothetical protein KG089_05925 [Carnobacteriaceae bacterium zg-ZUI252]|nr:hypothetical protein [Carnobacteriaceae bacterium zg-ZUI252]
MMKLLRKKVMILLLSLMASIVLCAYVYANVAALSTTQSNPASVIMTKDVVNVPVKIKDTSNAKYVSGMPETVTVHLTGPRNLLSQLTEQTLTVETTDLSDVSNGKRTIHFTVVGLPTTVTGAVTPATTEVNVQNLATSEVAVQAIAPEGLAAEGYRVGNVTASPEKVVLSGSSETIAKVDSVTAAIPSNVQSQSQTYTQSNVTVVVKDAVGNLLDVKVSRKVSVSAQIVLAEVKAPIVASLINKQDAYNYNIALQSPTETLVVNTSGGTPVLTALVDVSALSEGTHELTVPILTPYGVTLSQIRELKVIVDVIKK